MSETICAYGASGSSKSSQCAEFHKYERLKARALQLPWKDLPSWHVTGDSSFEPLEELISAGEVMPWNIAYETNLGVSPVSAIMAMSNGTVPKHVDPKTGMRLSNEWQQCSGSLSVEGLHVLAELWKYYLMSKGMMGKEFLQENDGTKLGTAHLAVYDVVKNNMHQAVLRTRSLAYCPRVLWTTHEAKGTDLHSASVLGPAILVNKGIDKVPGWFAHTLRLEPVSYVATINVNGVPTQSQETARLLYFEPHKDPTTGLLWPAKTSLSIPKLQRLKARSRELGGNGSCIPAMVQQDTNGAWSINGGITEFLRVIDGA